MNITLLIPLWGDMMTNMINACSMFYDINLGFRARLISTQICFFKAAMFPEVSLDVALYKMNCCSGSAVGNGVYLLAMD